MSRSSVALAAVLAAGTVAWLSSGSLRSGSEAAERSVQAELRVPLVEVTRLQAQPVQRFVIGQGDVAAFRLAAARAQSAGRVAEILVDRGQRVAEGQPVLQLTLEGVDSRLREAQAVLDRRQRDYDAQLRLQTEGFATAAQLRELDTQLQSAREEVSRLQDQIADTVVRAPFAGTVDEVAVQPGTWVTAGTDLVSVIENVPLRTTLRVGQMDRGSITAGREVEVAYATGETERGMVCFVAASADPRTRTFAVEVRTPNVGAEIPSGISAEVTIPIDQVMAQFVSPAILSLGTDGTLGIKTADADGLVEFRPVEVVRAEAAGIWVSGLTEMADVITLGQGFVQAGDQVRISRAEAAQRVPLTPTATDPAGLPADLCDRAPAITPNQNTP